MASMLHSVMHSNLMNQLGEVLGSLDANQGLFPKSNKKKYQYGRYKNRNLIYWIANLMVGNVCVSLVECSSGKTVLYKYKQNNSSYLNLIAAVVLCMKLFQFTSFALRIFAWSLTILNRDYRLIRQYSGFTSLVS